jgi:hypothetical protein
LYEHDGAYRALWDGQPEQPTPTRSLPCIHLGAVLERGNCPCPAKWLRHCGLHGVCTLDVCKTCDDYRED